MKDTEIIVNRAFEEKTDSDETVYTRYFTIDNNRLTKIEVLSDAEKEASTDKED